MDIQWAQGFDLQQALAMLEENDDDFAAPGVREIFITPPDAADLTDEDSADEDEGGSVDNLGINQLSASAEVVLENNQRISGEPLYNMEDEEVQTRHKRPKLNFKWIDGDLVTNKPEQSKPNYSQFQNKTVVEVFEMFLDDAIINLLVEESNKYAGFINCLPPNITTYEMRCFIGILFLTGYVVLPGKRFYWDTGNDMHNELVSEAMRRDRFIQIMRFLHCADNTNLDKKDKMCKLRPFIDMLKVNFMKYFVPVEHLNYDEAMVKYYGRHSCKQYIKGKPIRFGYKVWCLNTDFGYLVNMEVYQGSSPDKNELYSAQYRACATPLVKMLDELPNQTYRHNIYFDNLFTGFPLLTHLRERGYGATGTMRENRLPKSCTITDKKLTKKKIRGAHESKICAVNGVLVARWNDNAVVTMASTIHGIHPLSQVRRYSQSEKKIVQIPRPYLVTEYNKHMGGTDRMDQDIAQYRISIRGKKWYWSIFTWFLDAALHNLWIIYKQAGSKLTKREFRRELVLAYLTRYKNPPKGFGGLN